MAVRLTERPSGDVLVRQALDEAFAPIPDDGAFAARQRKDTAHIAHRLPLEQASEALGLLEFGKVTSKMALVPGFVAEEGTVDS